MAIGNMGSAVVPALVAVLKNGKSEPVVAKAAASALGLIGDKRAVTALIDSLFLGCMPKCSMSEVLSRSPTTHDKLPAVNCLWRVIERLSRFGPVRAASVRALGKIGGPRAIKAIIYAGLNDLSHAVVLAAAETLKSVRGRENIAVLIDGLDRVRGAYTWLRQRTLPEDVGCNPPEFYTRDDIKQMQVSIIDALTSITNQRFGTSVEQWRVWWKRNKARILKTGD